ncbi:DUF6460 domain-containing protein [Methylocapsa acidiphila]|uniref:DUF6460 domain-containing protein n=1 Tax=Methylocapsa acidiphila TaxID=133552 RepID=UPI0004143910|nr:DUF6460 domain-containing protein [Methylocapsa acidiphila]
MSDDRPPAPETPPRWSETPYRQGRPWRRDDSPLARFLGGAPGSVVLRLFFVSLIVGAFLMWLDIRPIDIFRGLTQFINRIWSLGFDAVREVLDYVLVGAAIVVPVWFVLRLLNMRGER